MKGDIEHPLLFHFSELFEGMVYELVKQECYHAEKDDDTNGCDPYQEVKWLAICDINY